MIDIACQKTSSNTLVPFSAEDNEQLKDYKTNQIVRVKVSGITKQRSLRQIRTYFACCKYVADNIREDDPQLKQWNTKEKVDLQIRVALHFVDIDKSIVLPSGAVILHYRSIAFKNLKHIEACGYFKEAIPLLAMRIGLDEITLINNVKMGMGG